MWLICLERPDSVPCMLMKPNKYVYCHMSYYS